MKRRTQVLSDNYEEYPIQLGFCDDRIYSFCDVSLEEAEILLEELRNEIEEVKSFKKNEAKI